MHCTQCGAAVPADARFCPSCGSAISTPKPESSGKPEKPKPTAREQAQGCAVLIVIIVVLVALLGMCSGKTDEENAKEAAVTAEDHRKGFHCLSKWDGSNRSLVEQVKAQLRDPGSFEHDETRIAPVSKGTQGKHLVTMRYRARNGFGGMNVGAAVALVDPVTCEATLVTAGE